MRKYLTNMVISSVKPKVNKTKLSKATSELNKAIQKTKGSKAKLSQTLFEIKNKIYLEKLTASINDNRIFTSIENFQEVLSLLQPNNHKS